MKPAAFAKLNLDAFQNNLDVVRKYAPNSKVMAMIKANAYGHGMVRAAKSLCEADGYAVARVDEGIRLRNEGIVQPIVVMEGFTCPEELEKLIFYKLDSLIHTLEQLNILDQYSGTEQISIWLKIDTGMNRLGFSPAQFNKVYDRVLNCSMIRKPVGFMSHLANADNRSDTMTEHQIDLFEQTIGEYPGQKSVANSAGILAWPTSCMDWVRPGLMLYGVSPFTGSAGSEFGLKPVMELHSRLIAVKPIQEGERVGYGGSWICNQSTLLGVIAIGYGDGYPRQAVSGTPVLVNGRRVPLIGRVSMDMITVDLATQPDAIPGDPVILWGQGLAVEEIADWAQTIPYTLLCGITQRVQIIEN